MKTKTCLPYSGCSIWKEDKISETCCLHVDTLVNKEPHNIFFFLFSFFVKACILGFFAANHYLMTNNATNVTFYKYLWKYLSIYITINYFNYNKIYCEIYYKYLWKTKFIVKFIISVNCVYYSRHFYYVTWYYFIRQIKHV